MLACRTCFWAAEITRNTERVWCAHAVHHGWMTEKAACGGKGYKADLPRK
jgi:hypothetical protein